MLEGEVPPGGCSANAAAPLCRPLTGMYGNKTSRQSAHQWGKALEPIAGQPMWTSAGVHLIHAACFTQLQHSKPAVGVEAKPGLAQGLQACI